MDEGRCQTGVQGLDELLEGGFPKGRVILVTGGCGTGKTILAAQFLYYGASLYNEPGVLVTLEQSPSLIKADMKVMGFDLEKLEAENKLAIVDASLSEIAFKCEAVGQYTLSASASFSLDTILQMIESAAKGIGAKRVVVDSISALDSLIETRRMHTVSPVGDDARKLMLGINYKLQSMGVTSILISDVLENEKTSKYGVEEFVVDGVVSMHYNVTGTDIGRYLIIKKMRGTKHSENINSLEFVRGYGIKVRGF